MEVGREGGEGREGDGGEREMRERPCARKVKTDLETGADGCAESAAHGVEDDHFRGGPVDAWGSSVRR